MSLPRIAITMGDPAGVGPELCLHALANAELRAICEPVVIGDAVVLRRVAEVCGLQFAESSVIDLQAIALNAFQPGQPNAATGRASFLYIERAIAAALSGVVAGVATCPISKEAQHLAGYTQYPGHTEIFAEKMNAHHACMMLTAPEITCSLVTVHVGLHEVPSLLSTARILEVIELTADAMRKIRGHEPRLAVCGLNPHAGENGLFGQREEERFIMPAIAAAKEKGIIVEGPLPPDTAFLTARRKRTDAYVCMYHDQGLIPLKTLAFDDAVNITLGLPVVRTSVDHGTALDIAWQGKANPNSLFEAVKLAVRLAAGT